MNGDWRYLLVGAAVVFVVFLLVKMRPAWPLRARSSAEVRAARDRAREATTARGKAEALCEAGEIAARSALAVSSVGYFLRAMRADPEWPLAVERTARALARRPRLVERIMWRRLAEVPWDSEHREALRAAAFALRDVYDGRLRDRIRAEVANKIAAKL